MEKKNKKKTGKKRKFFSTAYRKIGEFIHRPWFYDKRFLVTLSVLCSVFLWAVLATNVSPVETKIITGVHITINEEGLEENFGVRFVEVISPESMKDQLFDVKVSGRKYLLSQLTADDFTAVATANKSVSKPGAYDFTVTVSCNNPLLDVSVANNSQQIYVKFDRYVDKEFAVSNVVGVGATAHSDSGLVMGTHYSNVAKVRIEGPETEVSQIASVIVSADVNKELSDAETFQGSEVFLNEEGEEITLSEHITVTSYTADDNIADGVWVTIPIKTSKKFKIDLSFKNAPSNFDVSKLPISISPGSITLVGTPDAINNLSETYTAGEIDLSKLSNKVNNFTFDLSLSTGVETSDSVEQIKVKVNLSKYSVETFSVNSSHSEFNIVNYTGTRKVSFKTQSLDNIQIIGPASTVAGLKSADIIVEADMTGKETVTGACTVNATISVKNHSNCWAIGTYEVDVVIGK